MKATAVIERGADGTYGVFIESDNVPFGILGDGKTVAEAIADFYLSLEDMREYYEEIGKEFPEDLEFEFKYDTASFLQQYAYAFTLAGLERITGINQRQLSHYINGIRKPSEKTIQKIEERLHTFGSEIAAVRFA
jgi:predicted RNase H-like HicB family nuclease